MLHNTLGSMNRLFIQHSPAPLPSCASALCFVLVCGLLAHSCHASTTARLGVLVPLRWQGADTISPGAQRYAAVAAMAANHINYRVTKLVPSAQELLPANFTIVLDVKDSEARPTVAVDHVVEWNRQGKHAIIGSYLSAVTGPVSLAASIASTPVVAWGSSASSLSDRSTYPTLSRTVIHDGFTAERTIQFIRALGWTRIAIVYGDEAWGRSFFRDATSSAPEHGVAVAFSVQFTHGDVVSITNAMSRLAESSVGVILCVMFDSDLASLASIADDHGLMETGHAWITPYDHAIQDVVELSPDPARTRQLLEGWLMCSFALLHGSRRESLHDALESEPLHTLNHSGLEGLLTPEALDAGLCDQYCTAIYDAVWAVAIAVGEVGVAADGAVDRAALLSAIRGVSFVGASGRVEFDAEGERDSSEVPFVVKNVRGGAEGGGGAARLRLVETWQLQRNGSLLRVDAGSLPWWPGGEQGWGLPYRPITCEGDTVFEPASQSCEVCARGSVKEGAACVRFDASVGIIVPLTWGGPVEPWALPWAEAAAMAAHHVNHRVEALVPAAKALLPAGFKLVVEVRDSEAEPTVGVKHAVEWNREGKHAIVGSYRSVVTGAFALAASIEATPVVVWAASASSLADRSAYPTLSRTNIHDGNFAASLVQALIALGWSRAGVVYLDDTWGRGLSQDFGSAATAAGLEILISADFAFGSVSGTEDAVARVAQAGARMVILCAYGNEVLNVYAAAEKYELVGEGHSWVIPFDVDLEGLAAGSADPAAARAQMWGSISAFPDPMFDGRLAWFQALLEAEPREHLNHSGLERVLGPSVGACDSYCPFAYDAVWTVAIAMARVGVGADGAVDKAALLEAIRAVQFEGASRTVRYGADGERDDSAVPVIVKNARRPPPPPPSSSSSAAAAAAGAARRAERITMVETWQWWPQGRGLERVADGAPEWAGGRVSWTPPPDRIICPLGSLLSPASLNCEPCPPGTRPVLSPVDEQGGCVSCPAGTHAARDAAGGVTCALCEPGSASEEGSEECTRCAAGSGAASPGAEKCLPCQIGSFAAGAGTEVCAPCAVGAYGNATGSTACRSCPPGMVTRSPGSTAEAACVCPQGSYLDAGGGAACKECNPLWTTADMGATSGSECRLKGSTVSAIIATSLCGVVVPAVLFAAYRAMQTRVAKAEARLQKAKDEESRRRLDASLGTLRHMHHCMVLMAAREFLRVPAEELRGMHEQLRNEGKLVFLDCHEQVREFKDAGAKILFFSYEWLSHALPGPNDVQLAAMRASAQHFEDACAEGTRLFVWMDIFSIPQIATRQKDLAVNSLYAYASCADVMVIIAPDSRHAETGEAANLETASRRVWLRAEHVSHMAHAGISTLYCFTKESVEPVPPSWLATVAPIFDGDMTCCRLQHPNGGLCDREKLVTPILGLYCDMNLKNFRGELDAEIRAVLAHLSEHKDEVFPATFEYRHRGQAHTRELFGDIISRADQHLLDASTTQTPFPFQDRSIHNFDIAHEGPSSDTHKLLASLSLRRSSKQMVSQVEHSNGGPVTVFRNNSNGHRVEERVAEAELVNVTAGPAPGGGDEERMS